MKLRTDRKSSRHDRPDKGEAGSMQANVLIGIDDPIMTESKVGEEKPEQPIPYIGGKLSNQAKLCGGDELSKVM
jgi:hypothetical protein